LNVQELLDKICDAYYLPAWCSPLDYVELLKTLKLEDIKYADWSKNVTPFWPAVVASALSFRGLIKLATSGWTTIRGAFAMALMVQGYQVGLIKFAIITARKPL
jgi:tocopherol O-methyltransferase